MGLKSVINNNILAFFKARSGSPYKFIYRVVKMASGKRKRTRVLRNANSSGKSVLQKNHFGNFSPIKNYKR